MITMDSYVGSEDKSVASLFKNVSYTQSFQEFSGWGHSSHVV